MHHTKKASDSLVFFVCSWRGGPGAGPQDDLDIAHAKLIRAQRAQPKIRQVLFTFVVGLATDFSVAWTAIMDARRAGVQAVVIEDTCRGSDAQGSLANAWNAMKAADVARAQSPRNRGDVIFPGKLRRRYGWYLRRNFFGETRRLRFVVNELRPVSKACVASQTPHHRSQSA